LSSSISIPPSSLPIELSFFRVICRSGLSVVKEEGGRKSHLPRSGESLNYFPRLDLPTMEPERGGRAWCCLVSSRIVGVLVIGWTDNFLVITLIEKFISCSLSSLDMHICWLFEHMELLRRKNAIFREPVPLRKPWTAEGYSAQ
jgi:hypothetical protein